MKKIIRTSILTLTFVFMFIFMAVMAEGFDSSRLYPLTDINYVLMQGTQIQEKHKYDGDKPIIHLNKHDLSLGIGKTYTLKATLLPGGKSVSVRWYSSNPMTAWVSSTGKVTAVAPGTAIIYAFSNEYSDYSDETGYSYACRVIVPGGADDAKPLGTSDWTYSYEKTQLTVPTGKYEEALAGVKKSIGGTSYSYTGCSGFYKGLAFGSKELSKAHTDIYIISSGYETFASGYNAREKSPLKTSRGIAIGSSESTVLEKYGFPTDFYRSIGQGNKTYKVFRYVTKTAGKDQYADLSIYILETNCNVSFIEFYLGKLRCS